jgi:hypothetical protein
MKPQLKKELLNLDKTKLRRVVFELLKEKKISYVDLSNMYISFLEESEREKNLNVMGLASMLSEFVPFNKRKKRKSFIESKSAYHILKSKIFRNAPIEKQYEEISKEYSEDENGIPNFNK